MKTQPHQLSPPSRRLPLIAVLLFVTFPLSGGAWSQTRDQAKQAAVNQLRQMTPEEIDQKLKELGITREEALRRAEEMGIELEELLQQKGAQGQAAEEPEAQVTIDPRLGFQRTTSKKTGRADTLRALALQERLTRRVAVPGFKGRRGIDSLIQPYGFQLFQNPAIEFDPSVNVATPPSYALGAGDELVLTVWGETRLSYRLTVNREGMVVIPDVGPVSANGMTLQQFRDRLVHRMTSVYSGLRNGAPGAGTFLDVSLGKLKTIQVYALGEVQRPGGYALTSMSTALNALFLAGGLTVDGSLRNIQVIRRGDTTLSADLYRYMLRGERAGDLLLQDGDIVFVRPASRRVAVVGEVIRPAIYDLREGETLADAIALAGGLRFSAYINRIHVERIIPFSRRREYDRDIQDIDLKFGSVKEFLASREQVEDGDIVTVFRITDRLQNRLSISGSVNKPGSFAFHPGIRVRDLILEADSLRRSTFSERGTIFRVLENLRREIIGFNPRLAIERDTTHNVLLANEDSVVIYSEKQFRPEHLVTVTGAVRTPGSFPRNEHMSISDLVVLAGGLVEGASTVGWEIARLDTSVPGRTVRIIRLDPGEDYWNWVQNGEGLLADFDVVRIPYDTRFELQKMARIAGYVNSPGAFALRSERERLADLFDRAGGVRRGAYLEGSKLIRRYNNAGLVPIDFRKALEERSSRDNVVLYDGDSVYVAFSEDVVYVSGEVYVPSPVLYTEGAGLKYYIQQAGDYKEEAESGKTVVFLPGGKKWDGGEILPGSTIFVPKKIEKEDKTLPIVRDLVTILASMAAITVALVQVTK